MGHPFAQLTMPRIGWDALNVLAILAMWAVMMAAMMLPSALPMVQTFARWAGHGERRARGAQFVGAYLAGLVRLQRGGRGRAQWVLQAHRLGQPDDRQHIAAADGRAAAGGRRRTSSRALKQHLPGALPDPDRLPAWANGGPGVLAPSPWARHGLFCLGCCWALMALLFVGGVMNLAWIAALSIVVAVEKLAPRGDQLSLLLGSRADPGGGLEIARGRARAVVTLPAWRRVCHRGLDVTSLDLATVERSKVAKPLAPDQEDVGNVLLLT